MLPASQKHLSERGLFRMGSSDRGVEIATGRRAADGRVRLSVFASDMLALTLEGHGERAPTLLLTREQAINLQHALGDLIRLLEETEAKTDVKTWQGVERRTSGNLG